MLCVIGCGNATRSDDGVGVCVARLLQARAARLTPFIDKTLYTSWNAMAVTAYLEAARILRIGRDALRYKLKKFGIDYSSASR